MAKRNRNLYADVLRKRDRLRTEGKFSVPDEAGSKVAILVPFIAALVQDSRDSRANFDRQTDALIERYRRIGRVPVAYMDASPDHFAQVLADPQVPTMVVTGFGNFSAVAVSSPEADTEGVPYSLYDWSHFAAMATHLKLGGFAMWQCGSLDREFNAPLGSGVVSSFANITAAVGQVRYTTDLEGREAPITPITTEEELTYEEVKERWPLQRRWRVPPSVPDQAYVAVRGVYNRSFNRNMPDIPRPVPLSRPDIV